ncbi:hypothetical protein [Sphingosinicella sp. YJ22]|uniref:hypothetical protein n=1 Tax=Sphingosinicella sp. YJ22 TaxID=1104780 RepID=UPI00140A8465|nr:hypothetical protein [Sphingosinicella sp. YJ22]
MSFGDVRRNFDPLFPPRVIHLVLEEPERSHAALLGHNLFTLGTLVGHFEQAVSLITYLDEQRAPHRAAMASDSLEWVSSAEQNRKFVEWKMLTARVAALTIGNYAETWQVICAQLSKCPTLAPLQDRTPLKEATRLFRTAFPGHDAARHAVAHAGKLFDHPDKWARHRWPGTNIYINQMMADRSVSSTVNGETASFDVTPHSLEALRQATALRFRSYQPIEDHTMTLSRYISNGVFKPPPTVDDKGSGVAG